jgi:hypothetical protein
MAALSAFVVKALKPYSLRAFLGACDRIRTYDLLITNQLLYQLSYTGT